MCAVVVLATAVVVTVKVVELVPAGTVTVPGTPALVLSEFKVTAIPEAPDNPLSVTVPVVV